jgi:hypothetical protein
MSPWRPSIVVEAQLEDFVVKGLLPPRAVAHWRAPPVEHEEPQLKASEIVSFLAFHEHELRYPMHLFLLGLLNTGRWSCSTSTQMGCCTLLAS